MGVIMEFLDVVDEAKKTAIHLVLSDVDGTMADSDHQPPEASREEFENCAANVPIVLVSARSSASLRVFAKASGFGGPVVAFGGALIEDADGNILDNHVFSADLAAEVKKTVEELYPNVAVATYSFGDWLVDDRNQDRVRYEEFCVRTEAIESSDVVGLFGDRGVHKLMVMADHGQAYDIVDTLAPKYPELAIVASNDYLVEIMTKGVSKAAALRILLDKLGVDPKYCIAFGDGNNDIDMLELIPRSFAMGNAAEATAKAAWAQLPWTNDEVGVLKALEYLL